MTIENIFDENGKTLQEVIEEYLVDYYREYYEISLML